MFHCGPHQKGTWFCISYFRFNELLSKSIFIGEHKINFMIGCCTQVMELQAGPLAVGEELDMLEQMAGNQTFKSRT